MDLHIDNKTARHLILHLQGLTMEPQKKLDADGLMSLIRQLGFVQVDSIQWVERAQHMTLYARNQTYRPHHLKNLIEQERALFEHWTHDASIIPAEFYPFWRHRFERKREKLAQQFKKWQGDGYSTHCDALLNRIRNDGSLMSRNLERPDSGPQEMWQWHDGKAALEFLWHCGELTISARQGFQKVYDLSERHIPKLHFDARVTEEDFLDWACSSAIERLGFAAPGDIARYWGLVSPAEAKVWVEDQLASGENLISVSVDGIQGRVSKELVARSDLHDVIKNLPGLPKRVRVLSPFDPVIRDRKRLEWLFGYDYRIEIYVPEAKRKWGYYVFPLLEGGRLIGRIDMRANRKNDRLEVKRLWLEEKVHLSTARKNRIDAELVRQARLGGVADVEWLSGSLG